MGGSSYFRVYRFNIEVLLGWKCLFIYFGFFFIVFCCLLKEVVFEMGRVKESDVWGREGGKYFF